MYLSVCSLAQPVMEHSAVLEMAVVPERGLIFPLPCRLLRTAVVPEDIGLAGVVTVARCYNF